MSKVLHHGDYSIQGFESMVTIERKQTSDFLTYIGVDRKRTAEKLELIQKFFFAALVIETDNPFDVPFFSSISVESIRGFLKQARVLYGLHIYWSRHRTDLEQFILDHLTYSYIILRRNINHYYGIPPDKSI
jgi:ERCC4-type nuclease